MYFVKERSVQYKKDHPDLPHKTIISKLSGIWNSLPGNEKEPYETQAKADKDRYIKEKQEYIKKNETDDKGKKKLKAGDGAAPEKKGK